MEFIVYEINENPRIKATRHLKWFFRRRKTNRISITHINWIDRVTIKWHKNKKSRYNPHSNTYIFEVTFKKLAIFLPMSQIDNGVRSVLFHISNLKIFLFFKDSISVVNNIHSQG